MTETKLSDQEPSSEELASRVVTTVKRLEQENQELRECLQWYIENDDTNEGGRWEDDNGYWLRGKRRAMKALGMEIE